MGSACHQLGVYDVLPELQRLLAESGLEPAVELKGAFCLDCCADGIALKHRDRIFQRVNPRNVRTRFVEEILPALQKYALGHLP
jgi:NADH:ubiquinone oxidoreductase subunit E